MFHFFISYSALGAPGDLLTQLGADKNSLIGQINCPADLNALSSAVKRAMKASADHSTRALLMHVKRTGPAS